MGSEGQEWAKISVRFLDDPDIEKLTNTQKMFYLGLVLYSAEHLTDGYCSRASMRLVGAKLKATHETRKRALLGLEGARLLVPDGDGWRIRNYFKWQLSRDQILTNRQAERQRKAEARAQAQRKTTESSRHVRPDTRPESVRQEVRSKKEEGVSLSSAVELSRAVNPQAGEEDEDKSRGTLPVVELVIDRLAAIDLARAVEAGQQIVDQVAYRQACKQRRVEANLEEITDMAIRYPNWPPEQIVSIVADGALARPRVPDYVPEGFMQGHRPDFKQLRRDAGLLKRVDDELGGDQ